MELRKEHLEKLISFARGIKTIRVKKLSFEIFDNNACTDEIFATLGTMYSGGGEMTDNINSYAGEGVAKFADLAIQAYCNSTDMTYYD